MDEFRRGFFFRPTEELRFFPAIDCRISRFFSCDQLTKFAICSCCRLIILHYFFRDLFTNFRIFFPRLIDEFRDIFHATESRNFRFFSPQPRATFTDFFPLRLSNFADFFPRDWLSNFTIDSSRGRLVNFVVWSCDRLT